MKLDTVKPGMQLQLDNGATVEVLNAPSADGRSVKIKYIDSPLWPVDPGTEEVISADIVFGIYSDAEAGVVR